MDIEPASGEGAAPSIHVERRQVFGFQRDDEGSEEGSTRRHDDRPAKDPFLIWIPDAARVESEVDLLLPQTV